MFASNPAIYLCQEHVQSTRILNLPSPIGSLSAAFGYGRGHQPVNRLNEGEQTSELRPRTQFPVFCKKSGLSQIRKEIYHAYVILITDKTQFCLTVLICQQHILILS